MDLNKMTFTTDEVGYTTPETVTVTMTVKEALWIAIVAGQQRGESPHGDMYCCLCADVFNRYWEDGVDDARKELIFDTPPIVYSE